MTNSEQRSTDIKLFIRTPCYFEMFLPQELINNATNVGQRCFCKFVLDFPIITSCFVCNEFKQTIELFICIQRHEDSTLILISE